LLIGEYGTNKRVFETINSQVTMLISLANSVRWYEGKDIRIELSLSGSLAWEIPEVRIKRIAFSTEGKPYVHLENACGV
jgi:hypothetical protein